MQQVFRQSNIKIRKKLLDRIAEILHALRQIPLDKTEIVLDRKRMQFEMDFFLTHFIADSLAGDRKSQLVERLEKLILAIDENSVFCHRDFHSRNMQVVDDRVCLVDFQDSLKGPAYYDLVSIVNDSYLDIGKLKSYLLDALSERGIDIDEKLYHLTALQRNIKALGTFGFQINSRKNRTYIKYIARTLSHIEKNPESTELFSLIRSAEPNHLL